MSVKNKKRRKGGFFKKYISVVLVIVLAYCAVAGVAVFAYGKISGGKETNIEDAMKNRENTLVNVDEQTRTEKNDRKINVALFGVDEDGYRTDVIIAASFDTVTKRISLVSVPRDTKVTMFPAMLADMRARGRDNYIPYQLGEEGCCKINEIHAFAGDGYRNEYSIWMLEELLDVDFDYYVNVNIEGFKSIVDAVGGVEFTVEQDLKYDDPAADLHINISAGTQVFDGEKAEGLVRFRKGYAQQDLTRIKVQQDFLKALMKKVLNTETLVSNLPALIKTFFKYVETDLTLTDALKYLKYLDGISVENVYNATIPTSGNSYLTVDEEVTRKLIEEVFYDVEEEQEAEDNGEEVIKDSKGYVIEVANGGDTNGLAGKKQEYLNNLGYNAKYISTYNGERTDETRIYVREEGVGEDLKELFDATLIVDETGSMLEKGTDIKIVLGLKQK